MIMIINKELEPLIASVVEKAITEEARKNMKNHLSSMYGVQCYADTDSVSKIKNIFKSGSTNAVHVVSDVSRETFRLSKEETDVIEELTRAVSNECGQVSCGECIFKAKHNRYNCRCLINQLNEIRRKHS